MKKRILLTAGLIGILLVSALAFTGCGEPEGTITVRNATTITEYTTVIVIVMEGSEEVVRQDVKQGGASVSFTLPVGDYTFKAGNFFGILGSTSMPVYNKSDRKYKITNNIPGQLSFVGE
jgi:predicted small secreted protein